MVVYTLATFIFFLLCSLIIVLNESYVRLMLHYFDVFCCSFFFLTKLNQHVFLGDPNSCGSFS
jgi:hypothetical protein